MRLGRHRTWARRRVQALLLVIVYALALPQLAPSSPIPAPAAVGLTGLTIPICSATGMRYVQPDGKSAPAREDSGSSGQVPHLCCGICLCGNAPIATPATFVLNRPGGGPGEAASRPSSVRHFGWLHGDHFDARAPPFSIAITGQVARRSVDG